MESKHFFLGGTDLDDFTKQFVDMAEKTILVANPHLGRAFWRIPHGRLKTHGGAVFPFRRLYSIKV